MDKALTISLKVTKEDRDYTLIIPYGAPMGETHDVICDFLTEITTMIQERIKETKSATQGDTNAV